MSLAALAVLSGCQSKAETPVPPQLIGRWTTENPKYKGLSFEITSSIIALRTAEGGIANYAISKFESSGEGKRVSYTFYGSRDGQQQHFAFFYAPIDGGELRFKNQIEIQWTKATGSHLPSR